MRQSLYGAFFEELYPLPLWQYTVVPRVPEDAPYITNITYVALEQQAGDVLEVWALNKRIALHGVQIEVVGTADAIIQPVTHSGIPFAALNCADKVRKSLFIGDVTPDGQLPAIIIDDPDYFGLRTISGDTSSLELKVALLCSDDFYWGTPTNEHRT